MSLRAQTKTARDDADLASVVVELVTAPFVHARRIGRVHARRDVGTCLGHLLGVVRALVLLLFFSSDHVLEIRRAHS